MCSGVTGSITQSADLTFSIAKLLDPIASKMSADYPLIVEYTDRHITIRNSLRLRRFSCLSRNLSSPHGTDWCR